MNNVKMLYYDKIDVSEGDANKTSESNKCIICRYSYFLDKGFKFQPNACNVFDDVLMIFANLANIAVLNIHRC